MIRLFDAMLAAAQGPQWPVMSYTIDEEADEPPQPDSWQDGSDRPMPWELADDEKYR